MSNNRDKFAFLHLKVNIFDRNVRLSISGFKNTTNIIDFEECRHSGLVVGNWWLVIISPFPLFLELFCLISKGKTAIQKFKNIVAEGVIAGIVRHRFAIARTGKGDVNYFSDIGGGTIAHQDNAIS